MNSSIKFLAVLAFVGVLAGGVHLSYGDYKGTGLSRLPKPALKPAASVAVSASLISNVSVVTAPQDSGADGA